MDEPVRNKDTKALGDTSMKDLIRNALQKRLPLKKSTLQAMLWSSYHGAEDREKTELGMEAVTTVGNRTWIVLTTVRHP